MDGACQCTRNYCMQQRYKYERGRIDGQTCEISRRLSRSLG